MHLETFNWKTWKNACYLFLNSYNLQWHLKIMVPHQRKFVKTSSPRLKLARHIFVGFIMSKLGYCILYKMSKTCRHFQSFETMKMVCSFKMTRHQPGGEECLYAYKYPVLAVSYRTINPRLIQSPVTWKIYSIASLINARKRLAYCSGPTVEIPSTLDPYLTVLAAFATTFFAPYWVKMSTRAKK